MRLSTTGRYSIIATTTVVMSMFHASADAQSLFNTRGSSGSSQASATSSSGSLYSRIGFPQPSNANQPQGAGGAFVGRSNRGFVGGSAASASAASGDASGNTSRGAAGARGGEGVAQRGSLQPQATQERETSSAGVRRTRIIPRHRIAFEFPAKQTATISDELTTQLANLAIRYPDFALINVLVETEGRVNLQGQVPSEDTRKLAAIIVGLEPGVRSVQNELTVHVDRD